MGGAAGAAGAVGAAGGRGAERGAVRLRAPSSSRSSESNISSSSHSGCMYSSATFSFGGDFASAGVSSRRMSPLIVRAVLPLSSRMSDDDCRIGASKAAPLDGSESAGACGVRHGTLPTP